MRLCCLLPQLKQHKNFFTDLFKGMYPRCLPCQFHSIYHSYINAIMLAFLKIDNVQQSSEKKKIHVVEACPFVAGCPDLK